MGKVGSQRNYGYGKQLAWAGKQALLNHYGTGHYATRQAHTERWHQFAHYLKDNGINNARLITKDTVQQYAKQLREQVDNKKLSTSYAQNILSTVNVVLQIMREDKQLTISPANYIGKRSHIRIEKPASYDRNVLQQAVTQLQANGQDRVAALALLTRDLGLRFREASLLDTKHALTQANKFGRINITRGTKGGRGNEQDRWVPINSNIIHTLEYAATIQAKQNNLIPDNQSYKQWKDYCYYQWQQATDNIKGFHDMRAAYACERYQDITQVFAPVLNEGKRQAAKALDQQARQIISQQLGHNRIDVIAAYIGSAQ